MAPTTNLPLGLYFPAKQFPPAWTHLSPHSKPAPSTIRTRTYWAGRPSSGEMSKSNPLSVSLTKWPNHASNVYPRHLGTTNCGRRHVVDFHQRPPIMAAHDPKSEASAHIEIIDAHKKAAKPVVGTIRLFDDDGIVLIPTPTRDPNGERQPGGCSVAKPD